MRKVKFNKFIPHQYKIDGIKKETVNGTGVWETDYPNEGIFHQWGNSFEEFENGPGNYSIAIIELPNGEVIEVLPSKIKFIS